jgi:NAD-reducing hydrogenase small subunit
MERVRIATVWLAGCSGCHMAFLDLDEWLFELAKVADIVFSPVADVKEFPEKVDVALIEGAVANEDNLEMVRKARERSRLLIAFGECAVTGNVSSLRNPLGGDPSEVFKRAYLELADTNPQVPADYSVLPRLLPKVLPLSAVVKVDAYLWGCPPTPEAIRTAIESLLPKAPDQEAPNEEAEAPASSETPSLAGR